MRKLRTVGRMLVIAAGCLAVTALLFHFAYRPWQLNWGATDEEIQRAMAGDELVPDPTFNATRAVTVNAPAEHIWPWIVQMGYRRAGFYSWDILDNDGVPSAERILPEYQTLEVGDLVPLSAKVNILVAVAEPNRRLLLMAQSPRPWTWSWGLYPIDSQRTRLVSRLRVRLPTFSSRLWIDTFEIVMMRKCLLGIKRRAERSGDGAWTTRLDGAHSPVGGSCRRGEGAGHPLRGGEMRDEDLKRLSDGYDILAEEYAERYFRELEHKPFDRQILDRFCALAAPLGPICDMGCGPGQIARYLKDRGAAVVGVDLSPRMVALAGRLNPEISFARGDMFALDVPDEAWGGIAAFYSLIHVARESMVAVLRELKRVLKPGGLLLATFHLGDHTMLVEELWDKQVSLEFFFYQRREMEASMEQADLEVVESLERDPYPNVEYQNRRGYVLARRRPAHFGLERLP